MRNISATSGDRAVESKQMIIKVIRCDGTFLLQYQAACFEGGEVFEKVADGFVIGYLFYSFEGWRKIVGFGGWVGEYMNFEG